VQNQWGGIENLSLIPGKAGASAVQNIGAYGVEVQNRIETVNGIDLESVSNYSFNSIECQFSYRDSIFKNQLKDRFIITSVVFKLDKFPDFKLAYGDLKTEIGKYGEINLRNVRKAIIAIRQSKLPDPKLLGNAGSFFKNPIVEPSKFEYLIEQHPGMPNFPAADGKTKLAAGWLIDQCGWKGFRKGDAGVHDKQALVLVNHGNASGREIYDLSEEIKQSVVEKFEVVLEREVNLIGKL
jgi:UDP-N-acetylmuramate dehydrogenase